MQTIHRINRFGIPLGALVAIAAATASCGIEKQSAPGLAGPSEFAMSINMTASPDTLPRDGGSQSTIVVAARNATNTPEVGRAITLSISPGYAGELSASQVTTGSDGTATVIFTAPSLNTPVRIAYVTATPVGSNSQNATPRAISIALIGPEAATPAFTFSPASPTRFALTVFDASGTTLEGVRCGGSCTYSWNFGGEATATGQVAQYRFQHEAAYTVVLTVTSPGGVTTSTQQTVSVGAGALPVPDFTVSLGSGAPGGDVVFNAGISRGANGSTIERYVWDFGDNDRSQENEGQRVVHRFSNDGTFLVLLTITDSNGLTNTISKPVTIADPD